MSSTSHQIPPPATGQAQQPPAPHSACPGPRQREKCLPLRASIAILERGTWTCANCSAWSCHAVLLPDCIFPAELQNLSCSGDWKILTRELPNCSKQL